MTNIEALLFSFVVTVLVQDGITFFAGSLTEDGISTVPAELALLVLLDAIAMIEGLRDSHEDHISIAARVFRSNNTALPSSHSLPVAANQMDVVAAIFSLAAFDDVPIFSIVGSLQNLLFAIAVLLSLPLLLFRGFLSCDLCL